MIHLPIRGRKETLEIHPTKIIALGKNYLSHIAESQRLHVGSFDTDIPPEPIVFAKTPNVLIGPGEPIILPAFVHDYGFETVRTHYEAELALIVKERCKHVSQAQAREMILGFTCMNDVSQRNIQSGDVSGWFRGKSLDTFGPIGPQVVLCEDLADPQHLRIQCRLNGRVVQDANTSEMIFPLARIVEYVSMNFTLMPGDIVMTGTPAGVGDIAHGDIVEVEIEEIGTLRNPVIDERVQASTPR